MNCNYRSLTEEEIKVLIQQNCEAEDWSLLQVKGGFNPQHLHSVAFSGEVKLGLFNDYITLPGGMRRHAAIRNSAIHNCEIGDNCLIENIQNYIANYRIGDYVCIQNVHLLYTKGESTFGNGVKVSVLNETGGREVVMFNKLSAHLAYMLSFYKHKPVFIHQVNKMIEDSICELKSSKGTIANHVTIFNSGAIKNVNIGEYAVIEGCRYMKNGSINSTVHDPVHIGHSVIAKDFIVSSGSKVEDGTMLTRCFVGQACRLGHTYSANDSLFFSNCRGENGEAASLFAGPYTVTHHKSTLLIAGMFSFMNAGSGSNQSNHMYKLGPIHQGVVERGGKTTSNSYILWPARIGAFSLIMGRHYNNADTSDMPFSYLIEDKNETILVPGVNLRSVGTIRDAQKFPKRDERKDIEQLDCINFNLLSPYTVQKMFRAVNKLKQLRRTSGETSEYFIYNNCKIKKSSLANGLRFYEMAIHKFLGNSLISRLSKFSFNTIEEIRSCLEPNQMNGLGDWCDLSGLLAPQQEIDRLISQIESGEIKQIEEINNAFKTLHINYYDIEWIWAWDKIKEFYQVSANDISIQEIIRIIEKWKESVVTLDQLIYEDCKKEFSLSAKIGFGLDGDADSKALDFEQVRGDFYENPFVKTVLEHIEEKTLLGNSMIERLEQAVN